MHVILTGRVLLPSDQGPMIPISRIMLKNVWGQGFSSNQIRYAPPQLDASHCHTNFSRSTSIDKSEPGLQTSSHVRDSIATDFICRLYRLIFEASGTLRTRLNGV